MKHTFSFLFACWLYSSSYAQQNFVEVSHYLFPQFNQGVVLMKDGKKNNALLNYNAVTEEMIFENKGMKLAIGKNQIPQIDTVFIEDRKFVVLNNRFVESIYHSKWQLYVEHKCKLEEQGASTGYGGTSQTAAARSASALSMEGRVVYDLELPDGYTVKPYINYWLNKNNELHPFTSLKELKKLFDDRSDQFKKYSKENRVKYNEQESIIQLIAFLESI